MKHKNIKKFSIVGVLNEDSDIPRIRAQYESLLTHDLRSKGYVPVLDLDTLWSTTYNRDRDWWDFTLSIYGIYLGKRKALEWEGIAGGKLIPKNTQSVKSKQF
jgi:hypothetical protein